MSDSSQTYITYPLMSISANIANLLPMNVDDGGDKKRRTTTTVTPPPLRPSRYTRLDDMMPLVDLHSADIDGELRGDKRAKK